MQDPDRVHAAVAFEVEEHVAADAVLAVALADVVAPVSTPRVVGNSLDRRPDLAHVGFGLVGDILIAGYAIVNDATVMAADHDFDLIAEVTDLRHEYVAPSS